MFLHQLTHARTSVLNMSHHLPPSSKNVLLTGAGLERPARLAEGELGPAAPLPGPTEMPEATGLLPKARPGQSRLTRGQLPGLTHRRKKKIWRRKKRTQRRERRSRDEADLESDVDRPPRPAMTTLQGFTRRRRQMTWEEAGTVIIPDSDDEADDEIHLPRLPRNPRSQRPRLDEADPVVIPDDNNDDAPIPLDSD